MLAQTHDSTDEPPSSLLFNSGKSRRSDSSLTEAFSGLANSISDVMKHNATTPTAAADSPSKLKVVNLRSKYLEQIRELHSILIWAHLQ